MNDFDLLNKEVFIFDVDGTLYSQKKMRIKMAINIMTFLLSHLHQYKSILAVYYFRKYREMAKYKDSSMAEVQKIISNELKVDQKYIADSIKKWMFTMPLEIIGEVSYKSIVDFINLNYENGKLIYIYSDYPAKEKVEKMGIKYHRIFTAEDDDIAGLKPNEKAMTFILSTATVDRSKLLYVGDRDEKDGESAKLVDIDYCDVNELKYILENQ